MGEANGANGATSRLDLHSKSTLQKRFKNDQQKEQEIYESFKYSSEFLTSFGS